MPMAEQPEGLVVAKAIDAEQQAIVAAVSAATVLSIEVQSVTWATDYSKESNKTANEFYLIGLVGFCIICCCYYCYC